MRDRRPSWLDLERLALNELGPEETQRVRAWIGQDEDVRTAYRHIAEAPRPALPKLEHPPRRTLARRAQVSLLLGRAAFGVPAVAALAVLLWSLPRGPTERTKGAPQDPIVTLVAERNGRLREGPLAISSADRLRLLVTCDPGQAEPYEVVVVKDGLAHFPLLRGEVLPCGNRRPVPGAFRVDEDGAIRICLLSHRDLPSREVLSADPPTGRGCIEVEALGAPGRGTRGVAGGEGIPGP